MRRAVEWKAAAIFLAVAGAGGALLAQTERLERAEHRRAAAELAGASAFALEQELSRSLTAPFALAALVRQAGGARDFEAVAEELLGLYGGIDSLQLAPDGVLQLIHPLPGNERALGLDLRTDPLHRADVEAAIRTRKLVLAGPFPLRQGGVGLAGRVAVFVPDGPGERFWGVASAIIRLPGLLQASRLERLAEVGYDYQLRRQAPATGATEVIASAGSQPRDPISIPVRVPGDGWSLSVAPSGGWGGGTRVVLWALGVLLVALLVSGLSLRVLRLPELLRQQVAARTAELTEALEARQKAEQALAQAHKLEAVGQLAGGVAHDFNNLLAAILGYADLLRTEAPPGSLAEEAAGTIAQAAQRAADLTRQLLAFARKGKVRDEPVDVHLLVGEAARLLSRTIDKGIAVVQDLRAPRSTVRGDAAQLQQVVINLAVNARDAMPQGGTLTLGSEVQVLSDDDAHERGMAPGECLVLSVTDTGVGIPAAVRDRIFEPFFTTKGEGRGTGLGLASAYGIARGHGGAIRVYSEEGRGSRFLVYLPLHGEELATARPPLALPTGEGRVLVIDDEEVVRLSTTRILASLGYQPVPLEGGAQAVDWVRSHAGEAAAALLDLSMPGLDGYDCFRAMRALDPALPVLVASGYARDGRVQEMLDAGPGGFVAKPYLIADLAEALARLPVRKAGPGAAR